MPDGTPVHVQNDRMGPATGRSEQQPLDLEAVGRLPLHRLHGVEDGELPVCAGVEGLDRLIPAAADDGDLRSALEPLAHQRAIARLAEGCHLGVEAVGRDLVASPDLLELAPLNVVKGNHRLETAVPRKQQMPVGAPLGMTDVDPPGCDLADLAALRIDQPEFPGHDPTVAAERLGYCNVAAGRRAARPAQLVLRHEYVTACTALRLNDRQAGGIPETLARPWRDNGRDGVIATPSGLPDIAVPGTELADAVLLEVIDPAPPPPVPLLPRIDGRQPGRQVLRRRFARRGALC